MRAYSQDFRDRVILKYETAEYPDKGASKSVQFNSADYWHLD